MTRRLGPEVYIVRKATSGSVSWVTKRDGCTRAIHKTLQQAVQWAKAKAKHERRHVVWFDAEGNLQGGWDYKAGKALVHPRTGEWL